MIVACFCVAGLLFGVQDATSAWSGLEEELPQATQAWLTEQKAAADGLLEMFSAAYELSDEDADFLKGQIRRSIVEQWYHDEWAKEQLSVASSEIAGDENVDDTAQGEALIRLLTKITKSRPLSSMKIADALEPVLDADVAAEGRIRLQELDRRSLIRCTASEAAVARRGGIKARIIKARVSRPAKISPSGSPVPSYLGGCSVSLPNALASDKDAAVTVVGRGLKEARCASGQKFKKQEPVERLTACSFYELGSLVIDNYDVLGGAFRASADEKGTLGDEIQGCLRLEMIHRLELLLHSHPQTWVKLSECENKGCFRRVLTEDGLDAPVAALLNELRLRCSAGD